MKQMGLAQFCKRRNPHEPVSEGGDAPNLAFLAGSAASAVGLDDSTSRAVANEVSAASSTRAGKGKSFSLEERRQIGQACRDRAGDLNRTLASAFHVHSKRTPLALSSLMWNKKSRAYG